MKHRITVSVLTCDRPSKVYLPLTSILSSGVRNGHLIIIDNGRETWYYANRADSVVDTIQNMLDWDVTIIKTLVSPNNRRRQLALDLCNSDYILYVDDDVFFTPGAIVELMGVLKDNPEYMFATHPFIDYKNVRGYTDFSLTPMSCPPDFVSIDTRMFRRYSNDNYAISDIRFFDSGFVMFDVGKVKNAGGWEDTYAFSQLGGCDTSMARKLSMKGLRGCLTVKGYAYHILDSSKVGDGVFRNELHGLLLDGEFDAQLKGT